MCELCVKRGKPANFLSEPKCAFDTFGNFVTDNWQCATMGALRDLLENTWEHIRSVQDENCGIVPFDIFGSVASKSLPVHTGFLVLQWYKTRGRTNQAYIISPDSTTTFPLTLNLATAILDEKL
jgi:hypothetical protein